MKEFVKSLLTNRFGIVLGTINVAYFLYQSNNLPAFGRMFASEIFICMNLPAAIPAVFLSEATNFLILRNFYSLHFQVKIFTFAFFIMVQWLLIAHLSRVIAQRIKPNLG